MLDAYLLERDVIGGCKVLQLIMAQAYHFKLKNLAAVKGRSSRGAPNRAPDFHLRYNTQWGNFSNLLQSGTGNFCLCVKYLSYC